MIETSRMQTNRLSGTVHAAPAQTGEKIRKASQQFEAVLLGNIFQKLQDSVSCLSGEGQDSSSKSFGELGIQQLATAAAQSGGIGISSMVTRYLQGKSNDTNPEPSALKLFKDVPINETYWQNSEVVRK